MLRNTKTITAITFLILLTIFIVTLILYTSYRNVYFRDFKTAQAVEDYVLSTITLQESNFVEIRLLVDNGTYGKVDCGFSPFDEDIFSCYASTGQLWRYYVINFIFENDQLINVSASRVYRGL